MITVPDEAPTKPPGRPMSDWAVRLLEALDDGAWHKQEDVVLEAMKAVPPPIAYRQAEYNRQTPTNGGIKPRTKNMDYSEIVRVGARAKVSATILSLLKSGRLEKKVDGSTPMLRLAKRIPLVVHVHSEHESAIYHKSDEVIIIDVDLDELSNDLEIARQTKEHIRGLPYHFPNRTKLLELLEGIIRLKETTDAVLKK